MPLWSQFIKPTPHAVFNKRYNGFKWFSLKMSTDTKAFEIRADDLPKLSKMNLQKFTKLETVIVKFTENPRSSDAKKLKVIKSVARKLKYLINLRKCKNFKNLVTIFHREIYFSANTLADPISLHGEYLFRPPGQIVTTGQKFFSVVCNAKEPAIHVLG